MNIKFWSENLKGNSSIGGVTDWT